MFLYFFLKPLNQFLEILNYNFENIHFFPEICKKYVKHLMYFNYIHLKNYLFSPLYMCVYIYIYIYTYKLVFLGLINSF